MDAGERRMESAARQAVRQRNYRRARDRALVRLAQAYPDTYRDLLEEERKADEREGKTWVSLAGSSSSVGNTHTRTRQAGNPIKQASGNLLTKEGTNQSNLEGEE